MGGFDNEEMKNHVKDKEVWLRFAYIILFGAAFYVSAVVMFLIAVVQFLAKLFSGGIFTVLSEFGGNLAEYQAALSRYLAFASDDKPFPFAKFPDNGQKPKSGGEIVPD